MNTRQNDIEKEKSNEYLVKKRMFDPIPGNRTIKIVVPDRSSAGSLGSIVSKSDPVKKLVRTLYALAFLFMLLFVLSIRMVQA